MIYLGCVARSKTLARAVLMTSYDEQEGIVELVDLSASGSGQVSDNPVHLIYEWDVDVNVITVKGCTEYPQRYIPGVPNSYVSGPRDKSHLSIILTALLSGDIDPKQLYQALKLHGIAIEGCEITRSYFGSWIVRDVQDGKEYSLIKNIYYQITHKP